MAIRDAAKICSYSTRIPVRNKMDEWKDKDITDKFISPIGKMLQQADDMRRETEKDINMIEPEFEYNGLTASKSTPEYWRNLGS